MERDWDTDAYFLLHESTAITFDITGTLLDWGMIDIDKLVSVIRGIRCRTRGSHALEHLYKEANALTGNANFDVLCIRPLMTGMMPDHARLTIAQFSRRNTADEINMRPFWCDRATAKHFFMSHDIHYSVGSRSNFVFALPEKVIRELGDIDVHSGRLTLFEDVRVVPAIPNM